MPDKVFGLILSAMAWIIGCIMVKYWFASLLVDVCSIFIMLGCGFVGFKYRENIVSAGICS